MPQVAIFHEQGLGKTKIAIDLLLFWLTEDVVDTVFVVTKKTLVHNWVEEISLHSYVTPRVLSSNRRENSIALNSPVLIYVLNYEVVSANFDLLSEFLRTCRVGAILDESHKIKNPEAKLSSCFHALSHLFVRRVIMTGTPVANRPYDVWSQIKFLDDGESLGRTFSKFKKVLDLPSRAPLEKSYVTQSRAPIGKSYGERLVAVLEKIKHLSIRETKETAGIQLPRKTIRAHVVQMEPQQAAIYEAYRINLRYELKDTDSKEVDDAEYILKRLLRLVQCASNPFLVDKTYDEIPGKLRKLLNLLSEIEIQSAKAIIWTEFVENVEWLNQKLSKYNPAKVHGSMPILDRNESIRRFKKEAGCRILLATPGAAKEGLTLTTANHAVFFDRGFSLENYLQAQDRIHRISQTRECFVHNLIAGHSIDEWVDALLNAKYQAAQLTQGDISLDEFNSSFADTLSGALAEILSPSNGTS